jgi:excinuclease UvrABC nuclease subunit
MSRKEIPAEPGVYAWYREGSAEYVGKAGVRLRVRVGTHLGRGTSLAGSAYKRNVAESLGISTPRLLKSGAYRPSDAEFARLYAFLDEFEVAWVTCASADEALTLERAMKKEWMPPLTKL